MSCLQCGKCCRAIITQAEWTPEYFQKRAEDPHENERERANAKYIVAHWKLIAAQRDRDQGDKIVALKYACDQVRDDNRCADYEHRPPVCVEHPEYAGVSGVWTVRLHPGCGYAK